MVPLQGSVTRVMSLRRNTTPKATEGGATRRLHALLELETRAATVGGSGRSSWVVDNGDLAREIAKNLKPKQFLAASAANKGARALAAREVEFIRFAQKYNFANTENNQPFKLVLRTSPSGTSQGGQGGGGYHTFLRELSTSNTKSLSVIEQPEFWNSVLEGDPIKRVQHLSVRADISKQFSIDTLLQGVIKFTDLKKLTLSCENEPKLTEQFKTTMKTLNGLTKLVLTGFSLTGDETGEILKSVLTAPQEIKELTFENCGVDAHVWQHLATLESTSKLTHLEISNDNHSSILKQHTAPTIDELHSMFVYQDHMTTFIAIGTGHEYKCMSALSKLTHTSLTHLDLGGNDLHRLNETMTGFDFLSNIKFFYLQDTGLRDTDIQTLVTAIERMPVLEQADFSDNRDLLSSTNGDASGRSAPSKFSWALLQALSTPQRLNTIDLGDTSFLPEHVQYLSTIAIDSVQNNAFRSLTLLNVLPASSETIAWLRVVPPAVQSRLKFKMPPERRR